MARKKAPELTFQQHIVGFLTRVHGYAVLEQSDITDTEHCLAEDHLWAFLKATQAEQIKKLSELYGTDAREEIFRALRNELNRTPLWMIFRQGLKVRGLEFRLYYPKPRSKESAGAKKYDENRITFRPHFYFSCWRRFRSSSFMYRSAKRLTINRSSRLIRCFPATIKAAWFAGCAWRS